MSKRNKRGMPSRLRRPSSRPELNLLTFELINVVLHTLLFGLALAGFPGAPLLSRLELHCPRLVSSVVAFGHLLIETVADELPIVRDGLARGPRTHTLHSLLELLLEGLLLLSHFFSARCRPLCQHDTGVQVVVKQLT
eukprot:TRINITY_DN4510_c0_g2_i2.p1 TRINITY_DN4510_c0_g2~~TRINITY_DN4510_c0_g2_i2.p1  ORF type:complete len:138 (+),score=1.81 TRINITY_DN4510_c0_g2_i2:194-607(+)